MRKVGLSASDDSETPVVGTQAAQPADGETSASAAAAAESTEKKPVGWLTFLKTASQQDVKDRLPKRSPKS